MKKIIKLFGQQGETIAIHGGCELSNINSFVGYIIKMVDDSYCNDFTPQMIYFVESESTFYYSRQCNFDELISKQTD